jgi:hypothetical protein
MSPQHESLTPGERRFLERQQEAATEGVTLPEYYRSHGLSLQALYSVRRQLVNKGVLPRAPVGRPPSKAGMVPGRFVAVQIATPTPAVLGKGCRLRSPSGWVIECEGLPDPTWVAGLMRIQP